MHVIFVFTLNFSNVMRSAVDSFDIGQPEAPLVARPGAAAPKAHCLNPALLMFHEKSWIRKALMPMQ